MKNKILKIWGLVMVVAILAGLLVPAAVPVSAANLAFTNVPLPNAMNNQFTQGTSVNQFTLGPDGKTAYAYSNALVNTARPNQLPGVNSAIGASSLTVTSSKGY